MLQTFDLTYLSLGAGVQSTTLYLMASRGELAIKPDVAIFADTQAEPQWVYDNLARLMDIGTIPIHVVSAGSLGHQIYTATASQDRFVSIPFWVRGKNGRASPGRRQCTREYKITPVHQKVRSLLGLRKHQKGSKFKVLELIGISKDEMQRMAKSRVSWVQTDWPLITQKRMNRDDCKAYLTALDYPLPQKSACVFCPYRHRDEWLQLKRDHPKEFARAVRWDELLRAEGPARGMQGLQYISKDLIPLAELTSTFEPVEIDEGMAEECEGMCGF